MRIDLHAHSSASDGTDPPAELVRRASAVGLDVLALTDHDTVAGVAAAAAAQPDGLTLVAGAEISCARHVHLLAYLFDPREPVLAAELARLRADRDGRGRRMVGRLQEMGVPVRWERVLALAGAAPVGRPHVAAALAETGAVSYAAAFSDRWLGPGGPAYVPKASSSPAEVVRLVRQAGGVPVCAHPGGRAGVAAQVLAEMAAAGLAGLEVDHPEHDAATRRELRGLAADLGLLVTGGSDYHGARKPVELGQERTDPEVYARIVQAASGAEPRCA